jgi:hypothetical protein
VDHDDTERPGWVRLPGYENEDYRRGGGEPPAGYPRGAASSRASGVRAVRRASNWTAAALIAGVAATAGYLAHHTQPAVPATTVVTPGAPGGASAASPGKPALPGPVVTSSGSGVAVTTGPNGARQYRYRGDD